MLSSVKTVTLIGLDAEIINVEVDIRKGRNSITIVGLADKAVSESKDRIIPAVKNTIGKFPKGNITVNLAPADLPKRSTLYDLPITIGILQAANLITPHLINKDTIIIGELALNGDLRSVGGILNSIQSSFQKGYKSFLVPEASSKEASLIKTVNVFTIQNLRDLISGDLKKIKSTSLKDNKVTNLVNEYDFKYVKGQIHARRAVEIAAAGGHNCLLNGVPGSGKTYLSKAMRTILPDMSYEEKVEVTRIYSVSGLLDKDSPLVHDRPFRSPHHSASHVSLVGGGSYPRPGEITLAHKGILFLDEFPEFSNKSIEALRQPLEDNIVSISRATGTITYPSNFTLIAAMNPCKCGYYGDFDVECTCTKNEYLKYQRKISGPIMDRIDLKVRVEKVKTQRLTNKSLSEESEVIKNRVDSARHIQIQRFKNQSGIYSNADMSNRNIKKYVKLNRSSMQLIKSAIDSLNLTARSYHRVLKVARTIADLSQKETVDKECIAEALTFRF